MRIIAILTALLCLWLCMPASVHAADTEVNAQVQTTLGSSGLLESPGAPSPSEDGEMSDEPGTAMTVYSLEELQAWIDRHKDSGGTVQLGCDITLGESQSWKHIGWYGDPVMKVDTGAYSIRIQGTAELFPHLEFTGDGGDTGVLHVERGGLLECQTSVTARDGIAIYQEEGALLDINWDVIDPEEEIHLAQKPVIWPANHLSQTYGNVKQPSVVLPYDAPADPSLLPDTFPGWVYQNGTTDYELHEIPVEWDLQEYQAGVEEQKRFWLEGRFSEEVETYREWPKLLVTFLNPDSATFLHCTAQKTPEKLKLTIRYLLDNPDAEHYLECSYDGETWETVAEDSEHCQVIPFSQEDELGLYVIWHHMEKLPRYFSFAVIGEDGRTRYSDTIEVSDDNQILGSDIGGGRNGETSPLPPPDLGNPSDPDTETPDTGDSDSDNSSSEGSGSGGSSSGGSGSGGSSSGGPGSGGSSSGGSGSGGSSSEGSGSDDSPSGTSGSDDFSSGPNDSPSASSSPDTIPTVAQRSALSETAQTSVASRAEAAVELSKKVSEPASATNDAVSFSKDPPSPGEDVPQTQSHIESDSSAIQPKTQLALGWAALLLLGAPVYLISLLRKK